MTANLGDFTYRDDDSVGEVTPLQAYGMTEF